MDELINDCTYQCTVCEETIKAYTTGGETNFCPVCGTRHLEEIED